MFLHTHTHTHLALFTLVEDLSTSYSTVSNILNQSHLIDRIPYQKKPLLYINIVSLTLSDFEFHLLTFLRKYVHDYGDVEGNYVSRILIALFIGN